jgi:hypothetical protein
LAPAPYRLLDVLALPLGMRKPWASDPISQRHGRSNGTSS